MRESDIRSPLMIELLTVISHVATAISMIPIGGAQTVDRKGAATSRRAYL